MIESGVLTQVHAGSSCCTASILLMVELLPASVLHVFLIFGGGGILKHLDWSDLCKKCCGVIMLGISMSDYSGKIILPGPKSQNDQLSLAVPNVLPILFQYIASTKFCELILILVLQ